MEQQLAGAAEGSSDVIVLPLKLKQHPGILLNNLTIEEDERAKESWSTVWGYLTCRCLRQRQTPKARSADSAAEADGDTSG